MENKDLSDFKWPFKKLSYPFKKRKKYRHVALIVSSKYPEIAYELHFSSEKKARDHIKSAQEALNNIIAQYEKQEITQETEEGFHL